MCSDALELHGFNSCGQGAEKEAVGFAKTFPDIPCVSQILGGPFLRLENDLAFHQDLDEVGEKHWLTGNVVLSTAYWFSILKISRIIHAISFIL